jgi:SAM-dependent methyltransferase
MDTAQQEALDRATLKLRSFWNHHFDAAGAIEAEDWFADFERLQPWLAPHLISAAQGPVAPQRILIVGCGNSTLASDILDAGYLALITCIDLSDVVIAQMRSKHASTHPQIVWHVADVCALDTVFPVAGCFDLVLDKGCADTLSFRVHDTKLSHSLLTRMFLQMARVLRPDADAAAPVAATGADTGTTSATSGMTGHSDSTCADRGANGALGTVGECPLIACQFPPISTMTV